MTAMAWWSRGKRANRPVAAPTRNLLVISDIHLGEDILIDGPELLNSYIRVLNGTLMGFLRGHQNAPEDGRPWHLIINGDMFDFVKMPLSQQDAVGLRPGSEQEALRKLDRIMRIHRPLFVAMTSFLLAGNFITIVEGNHDAEFFFDGVRGALRQEIVRLAGSQLRRQGLPLSHSHEVGERLTFSSWFVAEMGHYHIEHGHQYDSFCSFEHKLAPLEAPLEAAAEAVLTQPMSHRILPQVAELLGNFSTHGINDMKLTELLRLLRRLGLKNSWKLAVAYGALCALLLRQAGSRRRQGLRQMAVHQARRLRVLCAESCYSAGVLRALDKLKAPPAEYNLTTMLHLFWVDRLLVLGAGASVALTWLTFFNASWLQASMVMAFAGLCTVALSSVNPTPLRSVLRDAAAHIAQVTGAQYVIFGHSHQPECVNLYEAYGVGRSSQQPRYINGGSWVTREILRGDASEGMTFVKITARGAELLRWRGPDVAPICLQETGASEHSHPSPATRTPGQATG